MSVVCSVMPCHSLCNVIRVSQGLAMLAARNTPHLPMHTFSWLAPASAEDAALQCYRSKDSSDLQSWPRALPPSWPLGSREPPGSGSGESSVAAQGGPSTTPPFLLRHHDNPSGTIRCVWHVIQRDWKVKPGNAALTSTWKLGLFRAFLESSFLSPYSSAGSRILVPLGMAKQTKTVLLPHGTAQVLFKPVS